MHRAERSNGSVASSGNADDLAAVIDRCGGAVRIRNAALDESRKLRDLGHSGSVDDGEELEHLRQYAA